MIKQVEALLKRCIGLDAESIGRPIIARAVSLRMEILACTSDIDYWQRLSRCHTEQQALVEAVVVPETWFFRYPESFATLAVLARARQAELCGSRPLRLLSLPCSTGEEPYSIAMALLDAGFPANAFAIEALDISARALEVARQGYYGRNSFRGSELGFRERHFVAEGGGYRLSERVRDRVIPRYGNLLGDGLPAGGTVFDFVFCRNLLIYFDRATQSEALAVLLRLLAEGGSVFVGPAEASLLSHHGLQPVGMPQTFVFQRAAPVERRKPLAAPSRLLSPPVPRMPAAAPVPAPVRARPTSPPLDAASMLAEIADLANGGHEAQARAAAERYLAAHGPCAAVFYWLGLLSDTRGQADMAKDYYRKALYLEPEHLESLLHLAALLAAQGDSEGARRLQLRARRAESSGVKHDA